jgi:superkiller protein 3
MLERNNPGRAHRLFLDAVESDPANPSNHLHLGRYYLLQGQLETARARFRRAIALAPGRVEFRFDLASALQLADSYPQALAQYDTMIQLAPDNPVVRHNFAVCLYNLGRLDEARTELEAARRLGSPINPRFDSLLRTGRDSTRY